MSACARTRKPRVAPTMAIAPTLTLLALVGGSLAATTGTAHADGQRCSTKHISENINDANAPSIRLGALNLEVDWCFDGQKITSVSEKKWSSTTLAGRNLHWSVDEPQKLDKMPQNGGFWERETVLTANVTYCFGNPICWNNNVKLDLSVFGDGVVNVH